MIDPGTGGAIAIARRPTMRRVSYLFAALAFGTATELAAQDPPQDSIWITAAINRGQRARKCDVVRKELSNDFGSIMLGASADIGFSVALTGPVNRIECSAADAAKKYKQFTIDSMSPALLQAVLMVSATPKKPELRRGGMQVTPVPTHVVLIPGDGKERSLAVQPDSVFFVEMSWSNAMGGKFEGREIAGLFRLNQIPPGDFTVVIVTEGKEFRSRVSAKDRDKIR